MDCNTKAKSSCYQSAINELYFLKIQIKVSPFDFRSEISLFYINAVTFLKIEIKNLPQKNVTGFIFFNKENSRKANKLETHGLTDK